MWLHISIIILIIQTYVIVHTYKVESKEYDKDKIDFSESIRVKIPIWVILLILLVIFIPIVNIIELIVFCLVWAKYYCESDDALKNKYTYWVFKDKLFSKKI